MLISPYSQDISVGKFSPGADVSDFVEIEVPDSEGKFVFILLPSEARDLASRLADMAEEIDDPGRDTTACSLCGR